MTSLSAIIRPVMVTGLQNNDATQHTLYIDDILSVLLVPSELEKMQQYPLTNVSDAEIFLQSLNTMRLGACYIGNYALIPRLTYDVIAYIAWDTSGDTIKAYDAATVVERLKAFEEVNYTFWQKGEDNIVWDLAELCNTPEFMVHKQKCSFYGFECIVFDKYLVSEFIQATANLIAATEAQQSIKST
jgi:hypothetical protein